MKENKTPANAIRNLLENFTKIDEKDDWGRNRSSEMTDRIASKSDGKGNSSASSAYQKIATALKNPVNVKKYRTAKFEDAFRAVAKDMGYPDIAVNNMLKTKGDPTESITEEEKPFINYEANIELIEPSMDYNCNICGNKAVVYLTNQHRTVGLSCKEHIVDIMQKKADETAKRQARDAD